MTERPPARILAQELLSDGWGRLTRYTIDYVRRDGSHETQRREVYDRGHGAVVLPVDRTRDTVLLVRQFRLPVQLDGRSGDLIEACAGLNDGLDAETTIRKEAEEELGYRLRDLRRVYDVYMSPGSVSERLTLFLASYTPADRVSAGGGAAGEGEDIEVLEMPLDEAIAMVASGAIADAKTVILIRHAEMERRGTAP